MTFKTVCILMVPKFISSLNLPLKHWAQVSLTPFIGLRSMLMCLRPNSWFITHTVFLLSHPVSLISETVILFYNSNNFHCTMRSSMISLQNNCFFFYFISPWLSNLLSSCSSQHSYVANTRTEGLCTTSLVCTEGSSLKHENHLLT